MVRLKPSKDCCQDINKSRTSKRSKLDEVLSDENYKGIPSGKDYEQVKKTRRVEHGIMTSKKLLSVCVLWETLPVWLLSLNGIEVQELSLPQCTSFSHLASLLASKTLDTVILDRVVSHLGRKLF